MKIQVAILVLLTAGLALAQNDQDRRQAPPDSGNFIERLDKDGDSKVSQEEFDGPDGHFTQFDKNGDGYIEESEVPKGPPPNKQGGKRSGGGR